MAQSIILFYNTITIQIRHNAGTNILLFPLRNIAQFSYFHPLARIIKFSRGTSKSITVVKMRTSAIGTNSMRVARA